MKSFDEHFSDDNILRELCKARIKLAEARHERLFLHRISSDSPSADLKRKELEGLFPARKLWNRFRPRVRAGRSSFDLNVVALFRAVKVLSVETPYADWVSSLSKLIEEVQYRAIKASNFEFTKPKIIAQRKKPKDHKFRPLALYPLQEKIIDSLTARYLRRIVDTCLLPTCLAFRCGQVDSPPPTIHDALATISRVNRRNRKTGLFVAECDIKSFFDCVSHDVARSAVSKLLAATSKRTGQIVDPRALYVFERFLDSYSFKNSVLGEASEKLKKIDPKGEYVWPTDLKEMHKGAMVDNIGVPQGGALSCFIANAVLHLADKRQASLKRKLKKSITYLRYCDDILILSKHRDACEAAFELYNQTLKEILLPAHPAKQIEHYSRDFWDGKSNAPYRWANPQTTQSAVPWIQFVGFQMRYDGLVRIRPKSLKKQHQRLTSAADSLLAALNPGRKAKQQITPFAPGRRKRKQQIEHRFRQQLMSISVGRVKLGQDLKSPMPMCWANGFRGLLGQKIVKGMLSFLDRHRERQLYRIKRRLKLLPAEPAKPQQQPIKVESYYGYPFSYFAQFVKFPT